MGNIPKIFTTFWLRTYDMKCLFCSSCRSRRIGSAENICTTIMTYPIDYDAVTSDEAANTGKTLAESTHDKVNLVTKSKMITHATSLFSNNAKTMCFIYHNRCI